ncbi:MAG: aspartate kinase [Sandaracinaceae bacterium]|nr:aspartate kinase [Sandaracinaceae bacterium]
MRVMKFGGSSVADRAQIEKVLGIVRAAAADDRVVVVSSAHKGITDGLIDAARRAAEGTFEPRAVIEKQHAIAGSMGCPPDLLDGLFSELRDLLRGIHLVGELSPRSVDYISSFGERMSVRVLADFFTREGLAADAHDVWDVGFITDSVHGSARPLPGFEERVRAAFDALPKDRVAVVTGFIGKDARGEITTVGRNGSDLTATLLAAALEADEAQIWTDTDGVMTADPSVVAGARNIPHMRFEEAAELAYFGSRVLHPSTLLPAMDAKIPVRVLNTNRPAHPGTVIQAVGPANPNRATSIAYKEAQVVLTVQATRMFGEVGFLAKVFGILARHAVSVDVVSTSEVSVSLTAHDASALKTALPELEPLGEVTVQSGRTILAIVGQHLAEGRGTGAQILGAIADAGVNVEMISYASGSLNLQMVIRDEDIATAVATLHAMLFERG